MAGAPIGNQNARKAAEWRQALKWALENYENKVSAIEKGQALKAVAMKCVDQAVEGDHDARQEIANRLDGKVPQAIIGGGEDDPPVRYEKIERVIVDPAASNS